jgi:hypothetical protein
MESQPSIFGTVCQLSHTNADLFKELAALEDGRNHLDRRFKSELSALNTTISELGPVIDVLLLEKPPVSRLINISNITPYTVSPLILTLSKLAT